MSGAVAVGSLVVVLALGAPVASNLGLSVGLPSVGPGGIASQALDNPNFPTLGTSTTSVLGTTSPAPAAPLPTTTQAAAYDLSAVTSSGTPSAPGASPGPASGGAVSSHAVPRAAATAAPFASTKSAGAQASVIEHSQATGGDGEGHGNQQGPGGPQGGGVGHAAGDSHGLGHGGGPGGSEQHSNANHGGSD
jgi:hypothetical protein